MKNIWTGAISFGLIHIPVKLYSATKSKTLSFDFLRKSDLCPIGFARVCKVTGEEVPYKDIVRGYEYQKGDYVVLQDEDFKLAAPKETQIITITHFVDIDEIDPKFFVKPYYVGPDRKADKVYILLLEALKRSKKMGLGKFVLRKREHLVGLKAEKDVLVLHEMRFQEEIRKPDEDIVPQQIGLSEQELSMAIQLVESLSASFKPEKFHDTYTEKLEEIIEKKAKGKLKKAQKVAPIQPTAVPDLMAALRKSLAETKKQKKIPIKK